MKASVNTIYGPPEVLHVIDVPKPFPKENEVLIKIHTTTVNRTDTGFRRPEYLIVYLFAGIFKPKKTILGTELAGEIEAVGKNVTEFKVGDKVFGLNTFKYGTHAEYVCVDEKKAITHMPENMTFEEAGAISEGLYLAYNYLKKVDFTKNPKILINGTTGSIGSAALQLANYLNADITAVCNTKNLALIKSLGANKIYDYNKENFLNDSEKYDVILDAVGKSSFFKCRKLLKPKGVYFSTELGYMSQNIFLALFTPLFFGKKVKFPIPKDTKAEMVFFKEIIEKGHYKAIIDKIYPLDQIVEATKYVETGEKTGNVVIKVC